MKINVTLQKLSKQRKFSFDIYKIMQVYHPTLIQTSLSLQQLILQIKSKSISMGLQSKPFNIKQLVDLNYQSQDNQHTIIINPQAQVEVQMIRQLAERLQEMSNLMRELVETMQRVNQQFNRSIGEMNRINRQTQNYMTQYLGIQNQILEISAQSEQSIDEQDQLQIQQKQNKNKQKKDGTLLYLCKLGLKISVPVAAFYLYRSLPPGMIQNTFTTAKKAFMSMFSSPIKYF